MNDTTQGDPSSGGKRASLRWARFEDPYLEASFGTWRRDFHIRAATCVMSVNLLLVLAGALIDVEGLPTRQGARILPYRLICAFGLLSLIFFLQQRTSAKEYPSSPRMVANIFQAGVTWGLFFYSHVARTYTIHAGHNDSMIIVPAFAFFTLVLLPRTRFGLLLMAIAFHFAMAFIHNLPEVPSWFAMQSNFSLFIFVIAGFIGHFWRHTTERRLFEYACKERISSPDTNPPRPPPVF